MRSTQRVIWAAAALQVVLLFGAGVSAGGRPVQNPKPPEDPRTILDRVYSVGQAERGEQRFKQSCSSCHTPAEFAGGAFAERWSGQTLGEAFEFVSVNMPENDPGGLKPEEYASVLAFILQVNAYPVGNDDLPADMSALKKFGIVPNPK
jgi:S-disulfanyl-L-cysteine oxidoreductase SoxD